jgi:4-hydroxy-2-oxoglutarate aldolase
MRFHGVFPPIPTSFDSTGAVDRRAIGDNVRRWMRTGLSGIVALGSNGEAALLDEDEGDAVVEAVRDAMPAGRVLIVGTGRESTRATIAATARAAARGADAVLVRTPSFFKSQMTADALVAHYTAVAEASPVPVLLYNLPGVTGISLTPATVATLAAHPNIAGMKETSPDLERLAQFVAVTPPGFAVFIGWAPVAYPALAVGAVGAILAVANVVPDASVALAAHVSAGRHAEAARLQRRITPLAQLVTATYGVPGLKLALELAGFHGGPARAPLLPPPAKARGEISAALQVALATD